MADKEATLKLTLKSDGFKAGLTDAEKAAAKAAQSIRGQFSKAMSNAGKEGLDALKGSLMSLKSAVGTIAGIGGGFGLVEFASRAIKAEGSFRLLSNQIRRGSGEMVHWRDLQREMQATALKTGHSTEELTASFQDLLTKSGDLKFTKVAMERIATAATATGYPMQSLVDIVDATNATFDVTADQVPDTLALMTSLASKSGLSIEEFAAKFELVGASAKQAGLAGQDGLKKTAALMAIADASAGGLKKGLPAITSLLDTLGNKAARTPILAKLGIQGDVKGDAVDVMKKIIAQTGGKQEKLEKEFSGGQLKILTALGADYAKAFAGTTGKVKEQTAAGLAAFDAALEAAGSSTTKWAELEADAAAQMQTPEMKIKTGLEKLAQAFTSDKMLSAFEQLGELLPKVMDQIMKHPILTGAILSGVPQAIAGSLGKSLVESLGKSMGSWFKGGAGSALAVGAVALGAYEGGKAIIDANIDARERGDDNTRALGYEATNDLSASRTMRGSRAQFGHLADAQHEKTAMLQQRFDLASNMAFGSMKLGRRFDPTHNRWEDTGGASKSYDRIAREQAAAALPGGSAADLEEWANMAIKNAEADARNINALRQSLEDSRRAEQTFASRSMQTVGPTGMADLSGATSGIGYAGFVGGEHMERPGLGLGGEYDATKGRRNRQRETEQAQEEARVAAQKQQFEGLAQGIGDAVGSKTLSVNIVESIPLKTDGAAPPAPGSVPR